MSAPDVACKVVGGPATVGGMRESVVPVDDAGRGGVAGSGGACRVGISGSLEDEGRAIFGIDILWKPRLCLDHEMDLRNETVLPCPYPGKFGYPAVVPFF